MRGGPTNPLDAMRCDLDDVLAICHDAHDILRAVITRMAQRARTLSEVEDVVELINARGLLYRIEETARKHHPDSRAKPPEETKP
jgi:hypothetical protein